MFSFFKTTTYGQTSQAMLHLHTRNSDTTKQQHNLAWCFWTHGLKETTVNDDQQLEMLEMSVRQGNETVTLSDMF